MTVHYSWYSENTTLILRIKRSQKWQSRNLVIKASRSQPVQVIPEIQANKEQIVTWRRHFHQHPEPSLKEFKTAEKIQEILTDLNVPFEKKVGETGTLGTITGTKNDATQSRTRAKSITACGY